MIIAEIGLNHLGDIEKLNKYLSRLKKIKLKPLQFKLEKKTFMLNRRNYSLMIKFIKIFLSELKKISL